MDLVSYLVFESMSPTVTSPNVAVVLHESDTSSTASFFKHWIIFSFFLFSELLIINEYQYFAETKDCNNNNCWHFNIYEQDKFRAQLS